jgi:hypothetical protein
LYEKSARKILVKLTPEQWSISAAAEDDVPFLGQHENRFKIGHLAAIEHYAVFTCTLFLTCFMPTSSVTAKELHA